MLVNRSVPQSTVIPELSYPDVGEAVDWLCAAFDFTLRLRIGNHRAQLNVGDGAIVVTERRFSEESHSPKSVEPPPHKGEITHSVMVRVKDANHHYEHATKHGARVLRPPTDHPFGERQYTVEDLGGHRWTFTQSIADVAPEEWGGTGGQL